MQRGKKDSPRRQVPAVELVPVKLFVGMNFMRQTFQAIRLSARENGWNTSPLTVAQVIAPASSLYAFLSNFTTRQECASTRKVLIIRRAAAIYSCVEFHCASE